MPKGRKSVLVTDSNNPVPSLEKNEYWHVHLEGGDVSPEVKLAICLNPLDLVARQVLTLAHSGMVESWFRTGRASKLQQKRGEPLYQYLKEMKVVAVVKSGATLYFATNGLNLFPGMNRLNTESAFGLRGHLAKLMFDGDLENEKLIKTISFINERDNHRLHAEMLLLSFCSANGLAIDGGMMGVSKPCCLHCANELDKHSISYSLYHEIVGEEHPWTPPRLTGEIRVTADPVLSWD